MSATPRFLPEWTRTYDRKLLGADVLAGLVVAVLVIPQSLGYALLAGLPPQAGLYASIFPVIAYALLGSSMTQAVGPVAITAIMTYSTLSPLAAPGSAQYLTLAATVSLISGVLILGFGILRFGLLAQLLSRPVVSGFISGSAILIVISQLRHLLGIETRGVTTLQVLHSLFGALPAPNAATLAIGSSALFALALSRGPLITMLSRMGLPKQPTAYVSRVMPVIVLAAATTAVVELDLDTARGVAVVGQIGDGAAACSLFLPSISSIKLLAIPAVILALIGMVQGISMAQALAVKRREHVDANRELKGLGAANIVAAFSGGMPVGGGLSRTAVNVAAGAQSPMASIVTAMCMLGVVLAGTTWLTRLPLAALAANIVVAAVSMIDANALRQAWAYDRADALALLGTGVGVVAFGLEFGIGLGIGLSLATLLVRASAPHIAVIGRIAGTEHFRNVERHGVDTLPGVLFMRIDEGLFFGNLSAVETRLRTELEKAPETHDVVLIMSAVNRIDTTAMEGLTEIALGLAERKIKLHLAEVKGPVQDRLNGSPLLAALSGAIHLSVNDAFVALDQSSIQAPTTQPQGD